MHIQEDCEGTLSYSIAKHNPKIWHTGLTCTDQNIVHILQLKFINTYLITCHTDIITFGFKIAIFIYAFATTPKIQILSNVIYITEDKKIKFEGA